MVIMHLTCFQKNIFCENVMIYLEAGKCLSSLNCQKDSNITSEAYLLGAFDGISFGYSRILLVTLICYAHIYLHPLKPVFRGQNVVVCSLDMKCKFTCIYSYACMWVKYYSRHIYQCSFHFSFLSSLSVHLWMMINHHGNKLCQ